MVISSVVYYKVILGIHCYDDLAANDLAWFWFSYLIFIAFFDHFPCIKSWVLVIRLPEYLKWLWVHEHNPTFFLNLYANDIHLCRFHLNPGSLNVVFCSCYKYDICKSDHWKWILCWKRCCWKLFQYL